MASSVESRHLSLETIRGLLLYNDMAYLQERFGLYVCPHTTKNISILNYGKVRNWGEANALDACRGLILESTPPYNVLSRGFDRFLPQTVSQHSKANDTNDVLKIARATVKEDGSLLFMFKYEGHWMLSTMHNFADGILPFDSQERTYAELFHEIIEQPLDVFAETLLAQFESDDWVLTFCFEMCSIYSRVIRLYPTPKLYLISAFGGENGLGK